MIEGHGYLNTCAHSGDIQGVRAHMAHSSQNERDKALWRASQAGKTEIVEYLLAHGADPQDQCSLALSLAAGGGHIDIVRILLPLSNMASNNGNAVATAAFEGKTECLKEILLWVDPFDPTEALTTAKRAVYIFQTSNHKECLDILLAKHQSNILSHAVISSGAGTHLRKM